MSPVFLFFSISLLTPSICFLIRAISASPSFLPSASYSFSRASHASSQPHGVSVSLPSRPRVARYLQIHCLVLQLDSTLTLTDTAVSPAPARAALSPDALCPFWSYLHLPSRPILSPRTLQKLQSGHCIVSSSRDSLPVALRFSN